MYTYDGNGNRTGLTDRTGTTSWTYDALNRTTGETLPNGQTISYGYDSASNLTSRTDSGGTEARGYDAANRLVSITQPGGAVIGLQYDAARRNTGITYPNGVTERLTYNSAGQVTAISATDSMNNTLTSYAYSYLNGTTPTNKVFGMNVNNNNQLYSYTYDGVGRLTSVQIDYPHIGSTSTCNYTYDNDGNQTAQSCNGTTTNATYNAANELTQFGTTTYSYDANGNQTGSSAGLAISYDAAGRTTSITPPGGTAQAMSYMGLGQSLRVASASTTYQYDASGLSASTSGGTTTYYTHSASGTPLGERVGTNSYYYLHDALGSVVGVTDSSGTLVDGYQYDPFGNVLSSFGNVPNIIEYVGTVWDSATQLYKMGERYYSPVLARFTQRDPVGDLVNAYDYVGNDPVNTKDPNGTWWCCNWWVWADWWGNWAFAFAFWLNHWEIQVIWASLIVVYPIIELAGAIIGWFAGGPIGAFIGGVAALVVTLAIGIFVFWIWITDLWDGGRGAWITVGANGWWWWWWWWVWVSPA